MITANTKKKKASDVMGANAPSPSAVKGIESETDLGEMKLKAILDKVGSDRELETVRDVSREGSEILKKFQSSPDEAMEKIGPYNESLKKLRRRGK